MPDLVYAVHNVVHRYRTPSGEVTAVQDVTLDIPGGGLTVLAGPSGSGKSTLLRVLGILERPTGGTVSLYGKETVDLGERRRRALRRSLHLVFQNPVDNLFTYLDVRDNLRAAAQLAGAPEPDMDLLDRLGLPGTANWPISALSGGQQQRLAFVTALAARTKVVLADEPTSQLDTASAGLVIETMLDLVRLGVTVVAASHDDAVLDVADQIHRLGDR
ncbi:ABC transporter ATP-binding protein [Actinocrispum wychmicini]|uniref:Putative ABC transport system ATP-binding protein/macrolide transport system ATP-binding/permease protein n=1 Tax=Actinocrispum wychmicini TaxID=1213861 RepID=A0A4R2JYB1_9PSEU|nr:ATP-binding cassette domain-containing protein [Actinocrispum wychmicini]TCO65593.1 putative ABC transport system ATP-binding protein/macrolide transport system ATP-binding/permease protein [Actinocrispum wychmicini]